MRISNIKNIYAFSYKNIWLFQKNVLSLQPQTRNDGAIAQLVEQRTENPCVPGSIPGGTTQEEKDLSFSSFYIHTYTNH